MKCWTVLILVSTLFGCRSDDDPSDSNVDTDTGSAVDTETGDDVVVDESGPSSYTKVVCGDVHSCALDSDGYVDCWGADSGSEKDYGQVSETPTTGGFVDIAAGFWHNCALHQDGTVTCWGRKEQGQSAPPPLEFSAVSAGNSFSCGIVAENQEAICWGQPFSPLIEAPMGVQFKTIDSKAWGTCGITVDDELVCWGLDDPSNSSDYGQISDAPTSGTWRSAGLGLYHSCAVSTEGAIECWGYDDDGQATPPEDNDFVYVSGGDVHSCALDAEGYVSCWGNDGVTWITPDDRTYSQMHSGYVHVCGISPAGDVECWGVENEYSVKLPNWNFGIQ